jgi:hypothetical protein
MSGKGGYRLIRDHSSQRKFGVSKPGQSDASPCFEAVLGISRLWGWDWDGWGGLRDIDRERHHDQHPDGP